jgi:hypothetical protein
MKKRNTDVRAVDKKKSDLECRAKVIDKWKMLTNITRGNKKQM